MILNSDDDTSLMQNENVTDESESDESEINQQVEEYVEKISNEEAR